MIRVLPFDPLCRFFILIGWDTVTSCQKYCWLSWIEIVFIFINKSISILHQFIKSCLIKSSKFFSFIYKSDRNLLTCKQQHMSRYVYELWQMCQIALLMFMDVVELFSLWCCFRIHRLYRSWFRPARSLHSGFVQTLPKVGKHPPKHAVLKNVSREEFKRGIPHDWQKSPTGNKTWTFLSG